MYDSWVSQIESDVSTYIQYQLIERVDAPFPSLTITTSNQNESVEGVSDFPTVYVHLLPPVELGNDLYNEDVAAVRATFELQIYSLNQTECKDITDACIRIMKHLRFNVPMFPDPQTVDKKHFAIARFSRVLGNGELNYLMEDDFSV